MNTTYFRAAALAITLALAACVIPRVSAQYTVAEDRATGFEAVEGTSRENVSGLGLMVGAYGIVWAFTLLFLFRIGRLEADLAAEVARLDRALGPE